MNQVELIEKKNFVIIALNLKNEAFVIIVTSISSDFNVYPSHKV